MKKMLAVAAALAAVVVCSKVVLAADQASTSKFGYVDFQKTLNDVEEGKKAKATLKSEFDEKQKKLDAIQNELQAMKTDLDKQRLILSPEALKEKEEKYRTKFMELQQKLASYKEEIGMKEAKLTTEILVVVRDIVNKIGAKDGYTFIMEKSQDVVLYSPSNTDLTDRVVKEYNAMPKGEKDSIVKKAMPGKPGK